MSRTQEEEKVPTERHRAYLGVFEWNIQGDHTYRITHFPVLLTTMFSAFPIVQCNIGSNG